MTKSIKIENIHTFKGSIPPNHDLVVYDFDRDPMEGVVLYGFDEVGEFDHEFKKPAYAFVSNQGV